MPVLNIKKQKLIEYILAIIGSLIAVYICLPISKDINNYQTLFYKLPLAATQIDYSVTSEYLFWVWLAWIKSLGGSFATALVPLIFISLAVKLKIFRIMSRGSFFSYICYACIFFLLHEGTQFRLSIALAFALLSCITITQDKWLLSLLCLIIAFNFHITAILLPSIFFVCYMSDLFNKSTWVILILSILLFLFKISIIDTTLLFLAKNLDERYLDYVSPIAFGASDSFGGFAFMTSFLLVYIKYCSDQKPYLKSRIFSACLSVCVLGNALQFLFYNSLAISSRLAELLTILVIPPLAIIMNSASLKAQYISLILLILFCFMRIQSLY